MFMFNLNNWDLMWVHPGGRQPGRAPQSVSWHFIIWISALRLNKLCLETRPACLVCAARGDLWLPGDIFLVSAHVTQLGSTTKILFSFTYFIAWQAYKEAIKPPYYFMLHDGLHWWLFSRVFWINYDFKIVNYQPIIIFSKSCVITGFLSPACAASLSALRGRSVLSFSEDLD